MSPYRKYDKSVVTFSLRHKSLLSGIILVFISFLFWGRNHETYEILLLSGLAISCASFLTVLFCRDSLKSKVFWIAVLTACIIAHYLTEPALIKVSYKIYIKKNKKRLDEVNSLLLLKPGDIDVSSDTIISQSGSLNTNEINWLRTARKDLNALSILKNKKGIHYRMWGFIDVSIGITYSTADLPLQQYTLIEGNWFY